MAHKTSDGRYFAVWFKAPGQLAALEGELSDVRDDDRYGSMDCKYCYTDNAPTVSSYERVEDMPATVQALCARCGAGLTPTEWVDPRDAKRELREQGFSGERLEAILSPWMPS